MTPPVVSGKADAQRKEVNKHAIFTHRTQTETPQRQTNGWQETRQRPNLALIEEGRGRFSIHGQPPLEKWILTEHIVDVLRKRFALFVGDGVHSTT